MKKIIETAEIDLKDFKTNYGRLHKVLHCFGLQLANCEDCELCKYNLPCETATAYFYSAKNVDYITSILKRYYEGSSKDLDTDEEIKGIVDSLLIDLPIEDIIKKDKVVKDVKKDIPKAIEKAEIGEDEVVELIPEDIAPMEKLANIPPEATYNTTKLVADTNIEEEDIEGEEQEVEELQTQLPKSISDYKDILDKLINGGLEFNIKVTLKNCNRENIQEEKPEVAEKIEQFITTRQRGFKPSNILAFLAKAGHFISESELTSLMNTHTRVYFDVARKVYKLVKG